MPNKAGEHWLWLPFEGENRPVNCIGEFRGFDVFVRSLEHFGEEIIIKNKTGQAWIKALKIEPTKKRSEG
jgi:hypothetical protein